MNTNPFRLSRSFGGLHVGERFNSPKDTRSVDPYQPRCCQFQEGGRLKTVGDREYGGLNHCIARG